MRNKSHRCLSLGLLLLVLTAKLAWASCFQNEHRAAALVRISQAVLDSLYQQALMAIAAEEWMRALIALEKIQVLQPGYREVETLLTRARTGMHQARPQDSESGFIFFPRFFLHLFAAFTLLMLALLLVGTLLSESLRARVYAALGRHHAAMRIYERMLARAPAQVDLYRRLAKIYLILGRVDEKAMKAYETVWRSNRVPQQQKQAETPFPKQALLEGRVGKDHLEMLKQALQAERSRR